MRRLGLRPRTPAAAPSARLASTADARGRVALLVSTDVFENFYGDGLGLTVQQYLADYRNEWSWDYLALLRAAQVQPTLYVAARRGTGELHTTADGFAVRILDVGAAYRLFERLPTMRRSALWRYLAGAVNGLSLLPALRRAAAADRLDLLFVQEYWTGRFDVLAHTLRVPVVVMDHGMPERGEVTALKARALRRVVAATVQTDAEQRKLQAYGDNVVKLPNGIDTSFFRPAAQPQRRRVVVSVGRLLDVQKCQSDLLRALQRLAPDWQLALYGHGPDEQQLRDLACALQVQDRVVFHGFADRATLRAAYQSAGVFALPSSFEGLPLVLLEAMACGAPVVGSDIPPIAEVVQDGVSGLIVPVRDVDRLAAAIEQAWQERERLGPQAVERVVRGYSKEKLRDGLLALLDGVTGASPGGGRAEP